MSRPMMFASVLSLLAGTAALAEFDDGQGKVWRQLTATRGFHTEEVLEVCPADGVSPCKGTVRGVPFDGWRWATREQVQSLFGLFEPAMETSTSLAGPEYVLTAMGFFGSFSPTYEFHIVSTSYQFGGGWTSDFLPDGQVRTASVSARWPAFNGTWSIDGTHAPGVSNPNMGVWLWRPAILAGDSNCDGVVTVADIGAFVLALTDPQAYAAAYPECTVENADITQDGQVSVGDIGPFVSLVTGTK